MEDARSVHSLADDFLLPPPSHAGSGGSRHHKTISRSTDKSLDSLGLEDKAAAVSAGAGGGGGGLLLKREPPDGKEKPEPPKQQKFETLSRKSSKSDLIEQRSNSGQQPQQQLPVDTVDSAGPHLKERQWNN